MVNLSIVIVNYNTNSLTKACLNSILRSKLGVSYEIIIVDNNSSEKFKVQDKKCKVIYNKENLGFAKANNQGIKQAKGKYVLLLNSDTIVKNNTIELLCDFAEEYEDAGVVVPRLLNKDGSVQASVFKLPTVWRAVRQWFLGERGLLDKHIPASIVVEAAVMAAFLITPSALKKVGFLDERYFMYFEDLDYCRRVNRAGLKIYYLSESEVIHLHGASGGANRLLIESAKKYHGIVGYCVYTFVLWTGQKWQKFLEKT